MRGIYFGAPATVNELQAGNGASCIVGPKHNLPKHSVTQNTRRELKNPIARLLKFKRRLFIFEPRVFWGFPLPRQKRFVIIESTFNNSIEVDN